MNFNNKTILLVCIVLIHLFSSGVCKEEMISPDNTVKTVSQLVAGNYSGDGKYMPFLSVPLDLPSGSTACYVPNWASYLKYASTSAAISSVNDSTVNVVLIGNIYEKMFDKNFTLIKNGNKISDKSNAIEFTLDSESLHISFQNPSTAPIIPDCIPANKYYFVRKNSSLRYYCYALETWEFTGVK